MASNTEAANGISAHVTPLPTPSGTTPLIFISHDSRDYEFAEAFSKLLRGVSAGMLKSFRSSDKKGNEGIEFGTEWYRHLMENLSVASDVVCLFTVRSLDRPWILYEAGVAKGKHDRPVHGLALGVPLSSVAKGPFYQFQNLDDSEDSLVKLVLQLCRRVPGLEPDHDVVKTQVQLFKETVDRLKKLPPNMQKKEEEVTVPTAKVLEELKLILRELPIRIAERVPASQAWFKLDKFQSRAKWALLSELEKEQDPGAILVVAGLLREDYGWLYDVFVEAYRAVLSGDIKLMKLHDASLRRVFFLITRLEGIADEKSLLMESFRITSNILNSRIKEPTPVPVEAPKKYSDLK